MGFVSEELNNTEKRSIRLNKVRNMAVVYGKEASMWKVRAVHTSTAAGGAVTAWGGVAMKLAHWMGH